MQEFDGPGLRDLQKIVGISSRPGFRTDFDGDVVQQVLDVGKVVRRGRTIAGSDGVWGFEIQNAHAIANTETVIWDLYTPGAVYDGYPSPVPDGFDVWLLQPWSVRLSVAQLTCAFLFLRTPLNLSQGSTLDQPLAIWDSQTTIGGDAYAVEQGTGRVVINDGLATRLSRGSSLQFTSISAAALAQVDFRCRIGLFPAGLGQDAVGAG